MMWKKSKLKKKCIIRIWNLSLIRIQMNCIRNKKLNRINFVSNGQMSVSQWWHQSEMLKYVWLIFNFKLSKVCITVMASINWAKLRLGEIDFGRNCDWAKLRLGEIDFGPNCDWAKLRLGKMATGPNSHWAISCGQFIRGRLVLGYLYIGRYGLGFLTYYPHSGSGGSKGGGGS